ncbi:hypothetical protein GUITHDRAFT_155390 [Guillardia theta CCMP2712]|uniref:Uncharacterized protein n=1 Tax=Guillardia theta (strain CCMP2712) TaxID=905079 RepID=L1II30_GUITC|nr:hypothetical protein GUITHDRAFT_155390 [Guillardia theta CCMP2712]EKX35876.1 hypothetical protein GUITHDRAFT_155390 [Guillardia theta CCMP2712]|eukprot:XP_005822856.1 hypothetical protein GUITHDRAFT_155390 [Guillardia theta CCMP2712]
MLTMLEKAPSIKKMTIVHACVPYGNDCSQSILSNPPSNLNKHSLLKPFQHASLRSHHYSDALFDMANRL